MAEQAAQAAGGARVAFGQVSKVIVPASASVFPILKAAGASAASLFDLVKLEIFRDFFQIISLFFAGLAERLPSSFRSFWGNVADTFSVCFSCWSRDLQGSTFSIVMFVIVFLLSVCVSIYFMYGYWSRKADDDSSGLEVKKWGSRGRGEHRRAKYSALVLTTLYLPAFRNVVQVFSCDTKYVEPGDSCFAGTHNLLVAMSVLLLLLYLVPIPIIFYSIIQRSKPTVRLYDEEGNLRQGDVKYTDADYRQDLARDKSPYKDLYEPFERKWAYYKVLVLLMKALLVLPAALLVTTNSVGGREVETEDIDSGDKSLLLIQSIVMLIVLSLYTVLSTTTRPFLSDSDDWLDGVSRFCTLVVSLFGLLTYFTGADAAFGAVLNTLVALATLLMIVLFLGNIPAVAAWWQGVRQRIKFTPSRLDATASHVLHDELSLDQERKLRIWHEFWDVLFLQDGTLRVPHDTKNYPPDSDDEAEPEYVPMPLDYQRGHTPPYLINFQGTVGERHDESQQIVASESLAAYESTLAVAVSEEMGGPAGPDGMTATQEMRFLITSLTGVDVYWNGQVDGRPDGDEGQVRTRTLRAPTNGTGFGKLYVVPFPFTAVLTFDQGKDHVIFSSAPVVAGVTRDPLAGKRELEELIRLNQSPEVQAKKELRTSLRAMNGKPVYFYIQKMVTKTERKRVGTDSQGHAKYRTITHHVLMTFQNGNFHIGSAGNAVWTDPLTGEQLDASAGFSCAITYHDGFGTSDKGKHFSNESITIGHGDLGITNDFTLNDTVSRLLNGNPNRGHVAANYSTVLKRMQRYRDHYASQFQHKESVLSYAFWYFVYNFDRITVEELHQVLAMEKNALLNKLAEKYAQELEMVGGKLRYFDTHPSVAMWFSFWHDVWVNNQQLEPIGEHADLFDPFKETAICYRPMPREQLVELLEEHDLHGSPGCGGLFLGFFNDAILDQLYERMDYFSQQPVVENEQARAALSEQHPLLADPVRHYELTSAFFQNLLHDEVVDEGEPELFRRVETFNTADPEPQENPPMQPMQPGPDVAVQQVYGTQQPYGSQPPPYGAPAQQPYGAPVQQQYGAPVQQPYGAPVQQPYGAQPVVVPVQPAARTSPQVHPAPSGVMVPPTIQNLPPSGGGAPIIINANPGQIVVNSKPSSQE